VINCLTFISQQCSACDPAVNLPLPYFVALAASKEYYALAPLFLPHPDDARRFGARTDTAAVPAKVKTAVSPSPSPARPKLIAPATPEKHDAQRDYTFALCSTISDPDIRLSKLHYDSVKLPTALLQSASSEIAIREHKALPPLPPPRIARYCGDPASVFCDPDCHYRVVTSDYVCCG
jgi:hypothetical protein